MSNDALESRLLLLTVVVVLGGVPHTEVKILLLSHGGRLLRSLLVCDFSLS